MAIDTHWKPVPGFTTIEASSDGRLRRIDRIARNGKPIHGGNISFFLNARGYAVVALMFDRKRTKYLMHRLIALAFVDGHFDGATVDHIDGDKLNNVPTNLRWVTTSENSRLQNAAGRGPGRGERHYAAKLRDADIPLMERMRSEGATYQRIGDAFGVTLSCAHKVLTKARRKARD